MAVWIFPCNPETFHIHDAFREQSALDWKQSNYNVEPGDYVFIYVGRPESAIRYLCKVRKANKEYSTIDDVRFWGNPVGTYGRWMELELVNSYEEPGITLQQLRRGGLINQNFSMQGAIRYDDDLFPGDGGIAQFLSYWEIGAFSDDRHEEYIYKPKGENGEVENSEDELPNDEPGHSLEGYEYEALCKARVNHSVFRSQLINKYKKCCLCGVTNEHLLIASHIKPWAESTGAEKTDINNGLLLCPNHDKLFDNGFITFEESGDIKISGRLSENDCVFMNVNNNMHINMNESMRVYMAYHRNVVFE